jgi:hypothetical protein
MMDDVLARLEDTIPDSNQRTSFTKDVVGLTYVGKHLTPTSRIHGILTSSQQELP